MVKKEENEPPKLVVKGCSGVVTVFENVGSLGTRVSPVSIHKRFI